MTSFVEKLLAFPKKGVTTFDAVKRLDEKLGRPHHAYRKVHVAGTNGKGSVSWKIAHALMAEGFRVGLYSSPHLLSFTERIRVNGEKIAESDAEEELAQIFSLLDAEHAFFDLLTALAFRHFQKCQVDWAVIEVGLGGRLDPTNLIDPDLSIITSIGYDHEELLGDTLEKIAREKGGIIRPGVPLIVGPKAAPFFPKALFAPPSPTPFYDAENSAIAKAALVQLGISSSSIEKGIALRPPCRFECIGNTILDVAHNPDGFERLAEALACHFPGEKMHFIVGFSKDKKWEKCLEIIQPLAAEISLVDDHPNLRFFGGKTMQEALNAPCSAKKVICGSFYLIQSSKGALSLRLSQL